MSLISAHGRLRQEAHLEFKASLWATLQKPCLKTDKQNIEEVRNTRRWIASFIEVLSVMMAYIQLGLYSFSLAPENILSNTWKTVSFNWSIFQNRQNKGANTFCLTEHYSRLCKALVNSAHHSIFTWMHYALFSRIGIVNWQDKCLQLSGSHYL